MTLDLDIFRGNHPEVKRHVFLFLRHDKSRFRRKIILREPLSLTRLSRAMETAEAFESEFRTLVDELRKGGEGWEVRQEPPSGAYLHVSLPQWGDEDMNGIHIETYVLGRELAARSAPVALHCESGCPFQR